MRDRTIRTAILLIPFVIFGVLFAVGARNLPLWAVVPVLILAALARALRRHVKLV